MYMYAYAINGKVAPHISESVRVLLHSATLTSHYMSHVRFKTCNSASLTLNISHRLNTQHALRFYTVMLILFALIAFVDIFFELHSGNFESLSNNLICAYV